MNAHVVTTKRGTIVEDPPLAKFLFTDKRIAWVWVIIRVLIGLEWVNAASHKLSSPDWMETGAALQGFWMKAVAIPETGKAAISYDWYRSFLQGMLDSGSYVWFAKLVAIGELAIGIGLIIGAFVGIAAFFGALLNWNFIMAGSTSSNPILLVGAIVLILAWKVAGYYGADYFLLSWIGTPWKNPPVVKEDVKETTKEERSPSLA